MKRRNRIRHRFRKYFKRIIEEYEGQKIDDIRRYDVDIFTVGSDWIGKFDYLNELKTNG